MNFFTKIIGKLFGGGKGIIEQVSDVADKWKPSPVTEHKMGMESAAAAIEDQKSGDESQNSARNMVQVYHESWFDCLVDGLSRLVRPVVTYWIVGGLAGFWVLPRLGDVDPVMMNILWTVITFWFGSRTLFKDLPLAYRLLKRS